MIAILDGWIAVARRLARMAIWFGGALILASAFLIGIEVFLRKLFLLSIGGADELSGYAFAIGTSWGLAFTLLERANVRVDVLYTHFAAAARALCDIIALVALGVFIGLLGWHVIQVLATSLQFSSKATTPLATPLWIPQGLWALGFGLFLFAAIPLLLRTLAAFTRKDFATINRLVGARTIEDEVANEISQASHDNLQPSLGGR